MPGTRWRHRRTSDADPSKAFCLITPFERNRDKAAFKVVGASQVREQCVDVGHWYLGHGNGDSKVGCSDRRLNVRV